MEQKIIEIPQTWRTSAVDLPVGEFDESDSEILGIWADRAESAEEIARRIRDRNNGKRVDNFDDKLPLALASGQPETDNRL